MLGVFLSADARGVSEPRAGFWRRGIAWSIDGLVATVLAGVIIAIPVAWVFAATNGAVQFGGPSLVILEKCTPAALNHLPGGLEPPPASDANFAVDCRYSLLGLADTGRVLTVGKVSTVNQGYSSTTTSIGRTYGLGADGLPRSVVSLDGLVLLFFLLYLILLQSRYGATAGMALLKIRVIRVESPRSVGVPPLKALIRLVVLFVGFVPVLAYLIWRFLPREADLNNSGYASRSAPILLTAALLLSGAFYLWVLIDIIRRRDPVCDRIARTAVVLRSAARP